MPNSLTSVCCSATKVNSGVLENNLIEVTLFHRAAHFQADCGLLQSANRGVVTGLWDYSRLYSE
jgi:hypothetical protein